MKLSHVTAAVFDRPWFIRQEELALIAELTRLRVDGGHLPREEIDARLAAAAAANGPRRGSRTMGAVAVIPVYGLISPRANLMTDLSGGTTINQIRGAFRDAMADEAVGSILLDVDSPGGYVDGIEELATEIRTARGTKPIVAIADYHMHSGAYYLGAQADEVVASPSARVGSIGTVLIHQEFSKADEAAGVTTTIFRNPADKFAGNDLEPLSDAAREMLQREVDQYSAQFVNAVAKGRGVSAAKVRADFGRGQSMGADDAKTAGLVDRVEALDDTIRRLATGKGPVPRGTGAWLVDPAVAEAANGVPVTATQQGGDAEPADDPAPDDAGEAGTPPDRTKEAKAALALARAKSGA